MILIYLFTSRYCTKKNYKPYSKAGEPARHGLITGLTTYFGNVKDRYLFEFQITVDPNSSLQLLSLITYQEFK